jgi:hypothetical protein
MAESFVNSLSKSTGIVTTSNNCSVGSNATIISGISTVNLGVGYLVNNQHFRGGTKVVSVDSSSQITVDKSSTNQVPATTQLVSFLGPTTAYSSPGGTKSILIGGTFSNLTNNNVNITVEVVTGVTSTTIANDIPVPTGSSFVISDAGKTVLESGDFVNVYCDTENAIDVTLGILQGVN